MKEKFQSKKFGATAAALLKQIVGILNDYADQGYDLSLRQLYYQLVSRNLVENTERSYKGVGSLVSDARMAGLIDWSMIVDRGRNMVQNSHWNSPAEIVRSAADSFRLDRWEDQPNYIEVMVEKQALEGVLVPVCQDLDVPFTANKGYSSSSAMYEASRRYMRAAERDKNLHILYLGDHDPSGIDMTRDVCDRMDLFLRVSLGRMANEDGGWEVTRLALNMDQIEELQPPENPAKITDSRSASYIRRFGSSSWELDAIEPARLAQLVQEAINPLIDQKKWIASGKRQDAMKAELKKFADEYED